MTRRRRTAAALALACLLATAGCNAFLGGDAGTGRGTYVAPTVSSSDAATTADPTTERREVLAPGVARTGVFDPNRLTSVHASTLRATSFTLRSHRVIRDANGTLLTRSYADGTFGGFGQEYYYRVRVAGTVPRIRGATSGTVEFYTDGEYVVRRRAVGGSVNVTGQRVGSSFQISRFNPSYQNLIFAALSGTRTRVVDSRRYEHGSLYVVEATAVEDLDALSLAVDGRKPRNVSFRAVVSEAGVVRSFRMAYTADRDWATVRVVTWARYARLGETRVRPPDWYDTDLVTPS